MKLGFVALTVCVCSVALASDPGQPLDCSDWTILEPGITCTVAIPIDCSAQSACIRGVPIAPDNSGRLLYFSREAPPIGSCNGGYLYRSKIVARNPASPTETVIAVSNDRCNPTGDTDSLASNEASEPPDIPTTHVPVVFDAIAGRLLVPMKSYCRNGGGGCPAYNGGVGGVWLASFSGFATTFEILQTYTPQPALGFRVPAMPEGMAGADSFDTYWGTLSKPLDFTQAHPLVCDYPATPPSVGDYMSVADTVPTPAPGQGVFFVTAASYAGATRYGRQRFAGHTAGRNPALLPTCTP